MAVRPATPDVVRKIQGTYWRAWVVAFAAYGMLVTTVAFFGIHALEQTRLDPYFLEALSLVIRANGVVLVLVMLVLGLYAGLASQRLARPAERIEAALGLAAQRRDYSARVAPEAHDYLAGVAEAVNALLERLAADQGRLRTLATELRAARPADGARVARLLHRLAGPTADDTAPQDDDDSVEEADPDDIDVAPDDDDTDDEGLLA